MRWLVAVALVACTRSSDPAPRPPAGPVQAAPADAASPAADAPPAPAPASAGCIVDPAAYRACVARGSDFAYGPTPFIYCSGVAADTAALARQHADQQKTAPCSCYSQQGIARQRETCSMVP